MSAPLSDRPPVVFRIAPSATPGAHDASLDEGQERRRERTGASQVERLYRHAYRTIAVSFALALLGWGVFALLTDDARVLWWSAAMHSVQGLQLLLAWRFRRQGRAALAEPQQWLRRYLAVLALSAAVWGASAWWLLPSTNWTATSWLIGVLLAVAAAGAHLATPYRPAIYCWLPPVLLPLIAVLLREGLPLSLTLGSLVAVTGVSNRWFCTSAWFSVASARLRAVSSRF